MNMTLHTCTGKGPVRSGQCPGPGGLQRGFDTREASWTAVVLHRFSPERGEDSRQGFAHPASHPRSQSARGLAQSKT